MARTLNRLTSAFVEKTKNVGLHADGGNLYLLVSKGEDGNIRRSWVFRCQAEDGRDRHMGLGPVHTVSRAEAREKALEHPQAAAGRQRPHR
jgi:hypothetical protein